MFSWIFAVSSPGKLPSSAESQSPSKLTKNAPWSAPSSDSTLSKAALAAEVTGAGELADVVGVEPDGQGALALLDGHRARRGTGGVERLLEHPADLGRVALDADARGDLVGRGGAAGQAAEVDGVVDGDREAVAQQGLEVLGDRQAADGLELADALLELALGVELLGELQELRDRVVADRDAVGGDRGGGQLGDAGVALGQRRGEVLLDQAGGGDLELHALVGEAQRHRGALEVGEGLLEQLSSPPRWGREPPSDSVSCETVSRNAVAASGAA